jgi:NADH-quinone oxidoreductase subunit M
VTHYLLSILIWFPLVAALVITVIPARADKATRAFTVIVMLLEWMVSLSLWTGDYSTADFQFVERKPLVEMLGISYSLGVDGISLWLVLLTTTLSGLAVAASLPTVVTGIKEYAIAFLFLESVTLGALLALDLVLFYLFWELILVPMSLIIGIWGGRRRVYASIKYYLFNLTCGLAMLLAIIYLGVHYHVHAGRYSFELTNLSELILPLNAQLWLFGAFFLAFAVKAPLVPLHTWLPDAHVEAPTAGSVMLAAILLKLGCYGFLRFAIPLFPSAFHQLAPVLVGLAVVGIIYGAYCAWAQKDLKKLVAYSSVSQIGCVMLGIFALTSQGFSGGILQMINHGISTGALFLLVGMLVDRRDTRELSEFGGLAKVMPNAAALFVVFALSSMGLPATNGFIGEFMILSGTFVSDHLGRLGPIACLFAATGVILGAVYLFHAILKVFFGPISEKNRSVPDLTRREKLVLAPMVLLVFWIGLLPNGFIKPTEAAARAFLQNYLTKLDAGSRMANEGHLVPEPGAKLTAVGKRGEPTVGVPSQAHREVRR